MPLIELKVLNDFQRSYGLYRQRESLRSTNAIGRLFTPSSENQLRRFEDAERQIRNVIAGNDVLTRKFERFKLCIGIVNDGSPTFNHVRNDALHESESLRTELLAA